MEIMRFVGYDIVKDIINKLKEKYEEYKFLKNDNLNLFVFPEVLSKEIIEISEKINKKLLYDSNNKDVINLHNILYEKILDEFLPIIKKTSYENELFENIKKYVEQLTNFSFMADKKIEPVVNLDNSSNNQNLSQFYDYNMNSDGIINYSDFENDDSSQKFPNLNESGIKKNYDDCEFIDEKYDKYSKYSVIIDQYIHKLYYANIIVKEESFNNDLFKSIKKHIKSCKLLLDYKIIRDELIIRQCKIAKEMLDFRYNFIIPNLNLDIKKGGEIYYPPYGWFGIGLNVENIYKNKYINKKVNKEKDIIKAICYYPFINMSSGDIKKELFNIIMGEGFIRNNNLQPKCRYDDKRHKIDKNLYQKVGVGVYLSPKINLIEQKTGIIHFMKRSYKIALMVSVDTSKIRQSDPNYWVLGKKDIEINKIIFKEVFWEKSFEF